MVATGCPDGLVRLWSYLTVGSLPYGRESPVCYGSIAPHLDLLRGNATANPSIALFVCSQSGTFT